MLCKRVIENQSYFSRKHDEVSKKFGKTLFYHLLYCQEIVFNIIQTFTFHQGIGLSLQTLKSLPTLPEAITLLDIFSRKINRMSTVADILELGVMKQYLYKFILCLKHKLEMCIWLYSLSSHSRKC